MAWNNKDLKNPKWQRTRLEIMQRDNWACTAKSTSFDEPQP